MPMAVVNPPLSPTDRAQPLVPPVLVTDAVAKDAIISWYGGEFAAANAIIDALCRHLAQVGGGGSEEYEAVFTAVHRRRINWIPVLQMQKYHSIADVASELNQVAARKLLAEEEKMIEEADEIKFKRYGNFVAEDQVKEKACLDDEKKTQSSNASDDCINGEVFDEEEDDSPNSEITDSGSQEVHTAAADNIDLCSNHENCEARSSQIKLTNGFSAKEPVRGHMLNVVKGLKLYENVFTNSELSKLGNYVNELRSAGQNRQLSGGTYILFNKQMKGNKRELLQFGVPIFGHIQDQGAASKYKEIGNIEPIPALLQDVVDHLVQWQLLPLYKKPNSCIINFFDEGEHSQPFLKPPYLDQPVSTLFLNESPVVFGRFLVSDGDGNYKGPLMLHLQQGSLLVMRGRSADVARHVICPSRSKRVSITFFRVRSDSSNPTHPSSPLPSGPVSLYQSAISTPYSFPNPNGAAIFEGVDIVPQWGYTYNPMPLLMLAPLTPAVLSPQNLQPGGTGVFLPWNGSARKPARRLPPRARRGHFFAPQPAVVTQVAESA